MVCPYKVWFKCNTGLRWPSLGTTLRYTQGRLIDSCTGHWQPPGEPFSKQSAQGSKLASSLPETSKDGLRASVLVFPFHGGSPGGLPVAYQPMQLSRKCHHVWHEVCQAAASILCCASAPDEVAAGARDIIHLWHTSHNARHVTWRRAGLQRATGEMVSDCSSAWFARALAPW
jgi:hypothetical protein